MLTTKTRQKINDFFIKYLDEDVSMVEIVYEDLSSEGKYGYHSIAEENEIHVDPFALTGIELECAVVHEIEHLIQDFRNKSYAMRIREDEAIYNESISECCMDDQENYEYAERRHEIDSRIMAIMYIYEECGIEGVMLQYHDIYDRCSCGILNVNVLELINNMPSSEVKTLLLNSVEKEKEESNKRLKEFSKLVDTYDFNSWFK